MWYADGTFSMTDESGGPEMIGKKLNQRYEIINMLGEGATSTVYRGRDALLGREVALKVLHAHVRDTTRRRFFQEAMAAAQLNHPNIMAIYDRGEDDDRQYLVVEYVDGDPLTEYIPAAVDVVVALGVQIATALHYAHEREIIHRDIKPANIMVTPEGTVKIMDLGLALPREAKRVTAPGMVIGTPAYISPEQAKGRDLDRRTDIYSLGIVLFEMVTGQLPFNADDITALLVQHVQQPPPPPRLINPDIPMALENVILKVLEKDRDRRFQTCRALADALQATLPRTRGVDSSPDKAQSDDDATVPNRPQWLKKMQTDQMRSSQSTTIRIVLADDHTLLRRTLANFLETHDDIIVLAEAGDGNEAISVTIANQPDVLLLDLNMPGKNGLDVLPEIRQQTPQVKVLVLTGRDDDQYIMRALRAGAHGYVLKSTDENKLLESIRKVMEDELVLGRGIAEKVVGGLLNNDSDKKLSERELLVLTHVALGLENEKIGQLLDMDMITVVEINADIMDKLGVRDRNAAALKALREGLLVLEDIHELRDRL